MKRYLLPILALLAAGLLAGCAPWVKTEYAAGVNFERLESFAWQDPTREKVENPVLDSQLMDEKVKQAVTAALKARGYREVPAAQADFLVTYHAVRQLEEGPGTGFATGFGFYGGFGHPWYNTIVITNDRDTYETGVLVIDVLDRQTEKLLWRGWRSKGLNQTNFSAAGVARLVDEILAHFPPGAGERPSAAGQSPVSGDTI